MEPFEFMLSESQERMLICAKKGYEDKVLEIFQRWELDAKVIGEVTDTGNMELFWHGEKVADIPIDPVGENAPVLDRPVKRPTYLDDIKEIKADMSSLNVNEVFDKLASSPEVVDKSWIYKQYDSMVQTNTIKAPGSLDASAIRVKDSGVALSLSSDCNPRYCYIDPFKGAAAAVVESGRNVAMSGATPKAITDCLNYGNPENPEIMWQFAKGCEGIKEACKELNTPVVSGNVSLYNETNGEGIYPTPAIVMVGVNKDAKKTIPSFFQEEGNSIYLVGETKSDFGGSLLLKEMFWEVGGTLPELDYQKELKLWKLIQETNDKGIIKAAKDVNVGGVAIALYKMSVLADKGINVTSGFKNSLNIFSETFSRAIVEINDDKSFEDLAEKSGLEYKKIGTVEGDRFILDEIQRDIKVLKDIYFNSFQELIESDL